MVALTGNDQNATIRTVSALSAWNNKETHLRRIEFLIPAELTLRWQSTGLCPRLLLLLLFSRRVLLRACHEFSKLSGKLASVALRVITARRESAKRLERQTNKFGKKSCQRQTSTRSLFRPDYVVANAFANPRVAVLA